MAKNLNNRVKEPSIPQFQIDDQYDEGLEMSINESTPILSNEKNSNQRRKKKNLELIHNYRKKIMHLR